MLTRHVSDAQSLKAWRSTAAGMRTLAEFSVWFYTGACCRPFWAHFWSWVRVGPALMPELDWPCVGSLRRLIGVVLACAEHQAYACSAGGAGATAPKKSVGEVAATY